MSRRAGRTLRGMVLSDGRRSSAAVHFFISYSPLDEQWAIWIAWQLEYAGYRTLLQAWDFVPGTNFIDFMDRGVSESAAVIAILSRNYVRSHYGRLEWQAALRSAPDNPASRLITVRVEDFPIEGLLSTITFVDLVAVADPDIARARLLLRIKEAIDGRAKPSTQPGFPPAGVRDLAPAGTRSRVPAPASVFYPPRRQGGAGGATKARVVHLPGPRFGRSPGHSRNQHAKQSLETLTSLFEGLRETGSRAPDAVVITGGLTRSGGIREFDEALTFVAGLRAMLDLEPHRLAVVPGDSDVTRAASVAYFLDCEADEVEPQAPFWPKWRHFARFFAEIYDGVPGLSFTESQPWTLFEMEDLKLVVAGLNSTMAQSHRRADQYGWIGAEQARWFARRLHPYADLGWARIGAMFHSPDGAGEPLRDAVTYRSVVDGHLDLLLHDPCPSIRSDPALQVIDVAVDGDGKSATVSHRWFPGSP
jgi:hypothetical protein